MQTILTTQAQVTIGVESLLTALGIPPGSVIGQVTWDGTNLTITATGQPTTNNTITTWEQGQYVFSQANALLALGLPASAVINQASWDILHQQMTVLAQAPISESGTP